jgi:serine protease AprX
MARLALLTILLALLLVPTASAATSADWTGAVAGAPEKVSAEFDERLRYVLPDGTLRVMVSTGSRDAGVEAFARRSTTWVQWYGASPRFLARVTPEQLRTLAASDAVTFVEPDYKLESFMSGSTLDIRARGVDTSSGVWRFVPGSGPVGALASNTTGLSTGQATGAGATVAIVDSGIDQTHRDFGGFSCTPAPLQPCESRIKQAVTTEHLVGTGAGFAAPTTELASGHGTHVAGTVAGNGYSTRDGDADPAAYGGDGNVFGVAPQASLVSVKNGDTVWAGLSNFGLQWILDNHAEHGIRVVNNSWGCVGGCAFNGSSTTAQLFKDLYDAGVLVVFAAGNDGGGQDGAAFSGNAQSPYVLGVAAYDHRDARLADFSSRGDARTGLADPATWTPASEPASGVRRPDVGAPGVDVWSARTLTGGAASGVPRAGTSDVTGGGTTGIRPYAVMGGTSMAAPHVAGAGAVLLSACPAATTLDLMRAIKAGAIRGKVLATDGSRAAQPYETGYGGLDVQGALTWLRTNVPAC